MFHFTYRASDSTNPFIAHYVSLREHFVVQVPKGPSMIEEKLACPMTDAAHERRFLTAQEGSSAPTFLDQHVSAIVRTIAMREKTFLDAGAVIREETYSLPKNVINGHGRVELGTDLLYLGHGVVGAQTSFPDRLLESDFEDLVREDFVDIICPTEQRSLLKLVREKRERHYRQNPTDLRVSRCITVRAAAISRLKTSQSVRSPSKSSIGP